ncbi:hypothetical protein MHO82_05145 [Vibrio sp. Of7-15]|uniref:hypothetical protein n=1 Tax=Vibrio sp. Of7-15 TaxID=2724879 RepID=UPI001EF1A94C|nr:hypothetical protein [Vibrio sp. Of7-15]MCG7496237.1 hypothetical protein [Vibrio sp. Of7-15]
MFSIEGICDWCHQPAMVLQLNYCDGIKHHSCEKCNDYAKQDVRQFNLAEMALRDQNKD